jgi:aldose 1-epimerase
MFPLVPFCNRIAHGRFAFRENYVDLPPNFPGTWHPHALHGYGWLSAWQVADRDGASARLVHEHHVGDWPWHYRAEQYIAITEQGLEMALSVTNLGSDTMPAGLGFHPYFPLDDSVIYQGNHQREWRTSDDGLPIEPSDADQATNWWRGGPVGSRVVDTIYEGREGALVVFRPSTNVRIDMNPSPDLTCTGVYVDPQAGIFCIEPLSHPTDAINRSVGAMRMLAEGETMTASLSVRASIRPAQAD